MNGGRDDRGPGAAVSPVLLALGGLVALAAAIGIGRFIYTPILPLMMTDLGMSASASGMLASANFTGYLCGALLAAHPAFRRHRRPWLLAALVVSGVTTGAMAVGGEQWWFLSLRFTGGVASAFALVFASALVLDRFAAAGRRSLSALHFAGVGVGIVVSSLIAASLGGWGQAWRWQWLAGGVISLAATRAPWSPNAMAISRPIPRPAPVMRTTLPSKFMLAPRNSINRVLISCQKTYLLSRHWFSPAFFAGWRRAPARRSNLLASEG